MAYLSQKVAAISQYGVFGWCCVALGSFVLLSAGGLAFSAARLKWVQTRLIKEWPKFDDSINPLESKFSDKRIKISSLAHPITRKIFGKIFTECELVGPADVLMVGKNDFNGVRFLNCNVIPCKAGVTIFNAVMFSDIHMINGELSSCNLFLSEDVARDFEKNLGVTLTGQAR